MTPFVSAFRRRIASDFPPEAAALERVRAFALARFRASAPVTGSVARRLRPAFPG